MDPRRGTANARRLRREQTDAEALLWRHLRNEALGAKFRRQHPVGAHTADFACVEIGLVIELDGSQHGERMEEDRERADAMTAHGFTTIRFWNTEVLRELQDVLFRIQSKITRLRTTKAGRPAPRLTSPARRER